MEVDELTMAFDEVMALPNMRWRVEQQDRHGRKCNTTLYGSIVQVMEGCRESAWRYRQRCKIYLPGDWENGVPDRRLAIFEPGGEVSTADGVRYYYYRLGKWCRKRH